MSSLETNKRKISADSITVIYVFILVFNITIMLITGKKETRLGDLNKDIFDI